MTNADIVEAYLKYRKSKRTTGEKDNTLPLMPFFIMDTMYQIYCKDIKPIHCAHMMKKAKRKWADDYHKFNMSFFRAFNQEQVDYIIDRMDEFNEYIYPTVAMLKSAVIDSFVSDAPYEEKRVLASVMACNVLAQSAQHLYGEMYWTAHLTKEVDKNIEGIKKATYDFACFYPVSKGVDLTSSEKVMDMIDVLCKKLIKFLKVNKDERK